MAVTASEARARLFPLIEQVNADQEPVEIVSKKGTAYLMRSPLNAERLLKGVAQASAGKASERALIVE